MNNKAARKKKLWNTAIIGAVVASALIAFSEPSFNEGIKSFLFHSVFWIIFLSSLKNFRTTIRFSNKPFFIKMYFVAFVLCAASYINYIFPERNNNIEISSVQPHSFCRVSFEAINTAHYRVAAEIMVGLYDTPLTEDSIIQKDKGTVILEFEPNQIIKFYEPVWCQSHNSYYANVQVINTTILKQGSSETIHD